MALIYGQEILDLGDQGLLVLATDSAAQSYGPLPAHQSGFARWIAPQGTEHDRLDLCTLVLDPVALLGFFAHKRKQFQGRAVGSVVGLVDHLASLVQPGYRAAPHSAAAFPAGRVLLAFETPGAGRLWRLLDVPGARVVGEWGAAAIDALIAGRGKDPMPDELRVTLFRAVAGDRVAVSLGIHGRVLQVSENGLAPAPAHPHDEVLTCLLTPRRMLLPSYETAAARIFVVGEPQPSAYTSTAPRRTDCNFATARSAETFAVAHPGGLVEVVDADSLAPSFLRPVTRPGSKHTATLQLSPHGRYVLVMDPAHHPSAVVVDLQASRAADVRMAAEGVDTDRHRFTPDVVYRTVDAMTDRGGYVLENGQLAFTPFKALHWRPIEISGDPARRQPVRNGPDPLPALLDRLRWPAMALQPAPLDAGRSRKYGAPTVQVADWPRYAGEPMLLLCQVDLAEATAVHGWQGPKDGFLLFFTSYDEDEGPIVDDEFHPAAIAVRWLATGTPVAAIAPPGVPQLPGVPIRLEADPSDLPQTESAVVEACSLDGDLFAAYSEHVERQLPEGALAGDRLGGYPHLIQNDILEVLAAEQTGTEAADWRLLLQLDSDDEIMWGTDSGMVYFLVHRDDLRRGDFSRVVALAEGC